MLDNAAAHKQHSGDQAVRHHLEHSTHHTEIIKCGNTYQHKPHMADGGISNQLFQVILGECRKSTVNNTEQCQSHHHPGIFESSIGIYHIGHTDQTIAAHLQQYTGQQNRSRRRCLDVGIGQPGMHRHHRQLDAESKKQCREHQHLKAQIKACSRDLRY